MEEVGGVVLLPNLREEVGDAVWYVESYLRFRCECEASKGGQDYSGETHDVSCC